MGADPAARAPLGRGYVERFVPADDSTYADVRAMLHAAEAANFHALR
jgi:hypothetical protein